MACGCLTGVERVCGRRRHHFHAVCFHGCATIFNRNTFESRVQVNVRVWHHEVLQRLRSRRFQMASTLCQRPVLASLMKTLILWLAVSTAQVGDVKMQTSSANSATEHAFSNAKHSLPLGPSLLRGPARIADEWTDVCGFIKPPVPKRSF